MPPFLDVDHPGVPSDSPNASVPSHPEWPTLTYDSDLGPDSWVSEADVDQLISLFEPGIKHICHLGGQDSASQLTKLSEQHRDELSKHKADAIALAESYEQRIFLLQENNKKLESENNKLADSLRVDNLALLEERELERNQGAYIDNGNLSLSFADEPGSPSLEPNTPPVLHNSIFATLAPEPAAEVVVEPHTPLALADPSEAQPHNTPTQCGQCDRFQALADRAAEEVEHLQAEKLQLQQSLTDCMKQLQNARQAAQLEKQVMRDNKIQTLQHEIVALKKANSLARLVILPSSSTSCSRGGFPMPQSKPPQHSSATDSERSTGSESESPSDPKSGQSARYHDNSDEEMSHEVDRPASKKRRYLGRTTFAKKNSRSFVGPASRKPSAKRT